MLHIKALSDVPQRGSIPLFTFLLRDAKLALWDFVAVLVVI